MTDAPPFAMQFTDLSVGLAFLRETLGFTLVEERLAEDLAYVRDIDGDLLLLAGPMVNDLPSYLSPPKFVCHPGESIAFGVPELEDWQTLLSSKGIAEGMAKLYRVALQYCQENDRREVRAGALLGRGHCRSPALYA